MEQLSTPSLLRALTDPPRVPKGQPRMQGMPGWGDSLPQRFVVPTKRTRTGAPPEAPALITQDLVVTGLESGWETGFAPGMVVFSWHPKMAHISRNDSLLATLMTIPLINYYSEKLWRHLHDETSRDGGDMDTGDEQIRMKTYGCLDANDFHSKWSFYGILRDPDSRQLPSGVGFDAPQGAQNVCVTVGGTAEVTDVWGDAEVGDQLFLAATVQNNPYGQFLRPDGTTETWDGIRPDAMFQIVPCVRGMYKEFVRAPEDEVRREHGRVPIDYIRRDHRVVAQTVTEGRDGRFTVTTVEGAHPHLTFDRYEAGSLIYVGQVVTRLLGARPVGQGDPKRALRVQSGARGFTQLQVALS